MQIGITDDDRPVYRKIVKSNMANFVKQTSGYANPKIGLGVIVKELLSCDICAFRSSDKRIDILPTSGSGSTWNTWVVGFTVYNDETVINFANNIDWGAAYTLIATITYTKS